MKKAFIILIFCHLAFLSQTRLCGQNYPSAPGYGQLDASGGQATRGITQSDLNHIILSSQPGLTINPYAIRIGEEIPLTRPGVSGKEFGALFLGGWAGMTIGAFAFAVMGAGIGELTTGNGIDFIGGRGLTGGLIGYGIGSLLGAAVGVYVVGKREGFKVSFGWTLLGAFIGMVAGYAAATITIGILFIAAIFGPVFGGIAGFAYSRRWDAPPSSIKPPGLSALNPIPKTRGTNLNLFTLRF